jgi:hypothetical protein
MSKKRTINNIRFGIEIEVEFPEVKNSCSLIEKHRIIKGWTIAHDGSLDNGAEYKPLDYNKLHFNTDAIDQIKEIIGIIKAHKGNIRPSCGLHIHIDMKKFTDREIAKIIRYFFDKQSSIYERFKVLKSRELDDAKKIPGDAIDILCPLLIRKYKNEERIDNEYFLDRDFGLNIDSLKEHNSLEFRLFNGTIQVRKIRSYIKWCIEFCLKAIK